MGFENIIGQKKIIRMLKQVLQQNRLHHGNLFYGGAGTGKEAMAIELAKSILCQKSKGNACNACNDCRRVASLQHPDLIAIFPLAGSAQPEDELLILESIVKNPYRRAQLWANPTISIGRIRELRRSTAIKSFENKGRVVIIADADKMTPEAANALLKTLEEPPDAMFMILTTSAMTQLLPTIVSRCQAIRFDDIAPADIEQALIEREGVEAGKAKIVSRISFGNYRRALELVEDDLQRKREDALNVLRTVLKTHYDRLILVDELLKDKEKLYLKELLEMILLWFRDVLIFSAWQDEPGAEDKLVNIDLLETMNKFLKACPNIDFENSIFEIEHAIGLIDKNVNPKLILIVLFEKLQQLMWRKSNVR